MKITTLCFPIHGNKIFLSKKKKGVGSGYLNGYGGKVEPNEMVEEAAIRELKEEVGLTALPHDITEVAIIDFFNSDQHIFECHVFFVYQWKGEFKETEEMSFPECHEYNNLPFERMWESDRFWLPIICSGLRIRGQARYEKGEIKFEYVQL